MGCDQQFDMLMVSYTSGTTGYPKRAIITHERFLNNTSRLVTAMKMASKDISVNMMPYNHIFAPFVEAMAMLGVGGSFVLRERYYPHGVLQDIERFNETYIIGAPSMFITILKQLKHVPDRYNISTLRFAFSAAAPIPIDISREFERIASVPLLQAYGQTEVGPMVVIEPIDRPEGHHPRTSGKNLWNDIEIKIVDQDG